MGLPHSTMPLVSGVHVTVIDNFPDTIWIEPDVVKPTHLLLETDQKKHWELIANTILTICLTMSKH